MGQYGTLSVLDDLANVNETVAGFGEEAVAARFAEALNVHNQMFTEMASEFATVTDAYLVPYGGTDTAKIVELDEWGAADASKVTAAGNLGLPLRIYGGTLQWTRTWMNTNSVAKAAKQLDGFALADIQAFMRSVKRALFTPTNNLTYIDRLQTGLTLPLRALLNADGQAIPSGPSGATFDGSTHTHYTGVSTLTGASITALINNVVEHGVDGTIRVYIARADETTVRGFSGFAEYIDARITVGSASTIGNASLDVNNPDNRAIGVYQGAEVWVKPWIPANYQVAIDVGAAERPLGVRTRTGALTGTGAFQLQAENELYPLRAQHLGREYGVSVLGRHKAAVQMVGSTTYAAPTFS